VNRLWVGALLVALPIMGPSCPKVPIYGVNAEFLQADASWFAEEETLFIFYEVTAEQGIEDPSVIEITWATDDERVDWTDINELLPTVHTHLPIDCGANTLCGSTSLAIPIEPREVGIRLRYHVDGELALEPATVYNVVGPGEPFSHRSLVVYGVFEQTNQRVQWRSRHQFPTVRNHRAENLGLRRDFSINDQSYGAFVWSSFNNPYGYGFGCPEDFVPTGQTELQTDERAAFTSELPIEASDSTSVCAQATVTDAKGEFTTSALAQKNPEVRDAFPLLRSPVHPATPIPFFLAPCDRIINEPHEAMQRQRLQMEDVPVTCIDDWESGGFVDDLVVMFRDAIEAERVAGNDMVLVIGLHQDSPGLSLALEDALVQVVPAERHRSTPRLAGAMVYDSTARGMSNPALASATLWCPSTIAFDEIPDASSRTCAAAPDVPDFVLGPFTFGQLQILPTRRAYLDFIETYSNAQAGEVTSLEFLTPEFATTSDHIDLGEYGVVTFLNGETLAADADDAFSYCVPDEPEGFVFRSDLMQDPDFQDALREACWDGAVPEELCIVPDLGLLQIEFIGLWHSLLAEPTYEIGLFWEFPFLLRMEYEAVLAGSASAFGVSVPFGFASPAEEYFGTAQWVNDEFSLEPELIQCRRFCDHPTFGSAGVYHVTEPFRFTYSQGCYLPKYPELGDSGFPLDP